MPYDVSVAIEGWNYTQDVQGSILGTPKISLVVHKWHPTLALGRLTWAAQMVWFDIFFSLMVIKNQPHHPKIPLVFVKNFINMDTILVYISILWFFTKRRRKKRWNEYFHGWGRSIRGNFNNFGIKNNNRYIGGFNGKFSWNILKFNGGYFSNFSSRNNGVLSGHLIAPTWQYNSNKREC